MLVQNPLLSFYIPISNFSYFFLSKISYIVLKVDLCDGISNHSFRYLIKAYFLLFSTACYSRPLCHLFSDFFLLASYLSCCLIVCQSFSSLNSRRKKLAKIHTYYLNQLTEFLVFYIFFKIQVETKLYKQPRDCI